MKQWSPYTAGNKVYGGGRPMPNIGPVNKAGYRERDRKAKARRDAMLRRMRAMQSGNPMAARG
jgi:hypothetical protein